MASAKQVETEKLIRQCLSFWECGQPVYPGALFADSETETVEQAAKRLLANGQATAPKLLESLEWALGNIARPTLIRGQNDKHFASYQAAEAAIRKARGIL